jgi:hypothetical protein
MQSEAFNRAVLHLWGSGHSARINSALKQISVKQNSSITHAQILPSNKQDLMSLDP